MKKNFAFLTISETFQSIALLPKEAKEKKNPFIIINTDDDRGLYIKALEKEISKYKGLKSNDREERFHDIQTNNLIVFGDITKFDYRVEKMNYITLASLAGKDAKVYDVVSDFPKIVRRLATYCKNNEIKRKMAYRDELYQRFLGIELGVFVPEEPKKKFVCPLLQQKEELVCVRRPIQKRTLVNVCSKPDLRVEKVTVHANWVKIGWNQYDIWVDLCGREFIELEDGERFYVKTDRYGRRYLATA